MNRTVTLVDETGAALGTEDIIVAHTGKGSLHRAFSVYVFRKDREQILIQRRAAAKMLWAGIWANTCCSHPFENEGATAAGERRLREELGFSVPLKPVADFVYRAEDPFGKGVEHEYVTILAGDAPEDMEVRPNPDEVMEWKWIDLEELGPDMVAHPDAYAPWFHQGLELLLRSR